MLKCGISIKLEDLMKYLNSNYYTLNQIDKKISRVK